MTWAELKTLAEQLHAEDDSEVTIMLPSGPVEVRGVTVFPAPHQEISLYTYSIEEALNAR